MHTLAFCGLFAEKSFIFQTSRQSGKQWWFACCGCCIHNTHQPAHCTRGYPSLSLSFLTLPPWAKMLRRGATAVRSVVRQRVRGGAPAGGIPGVPTSGQMSAEMQSYVRTQHQLFNKVCCGCDREVLFACLCAATTACWRPRVQVGGCVDVFVSRLLASPTSSSPLPSSLRCVTASGQGPVGVLGGVFLPVRCNPRACGPGILVRAQHRHHRLGSR